MHQLEHGGNSIFVSRIDVQENALECKILVQLAIRLLGPAGCGKSEELRDNEQVVMQGLGGVLISLVLELCQRSLVLLLELLGEGLFESSLLTC